MRALIKITYLLMIFALLQIDKPFISEESLYHFSAVYLGHKGKEAKFQVTADSLILGKNLIDNLPLYSKDNKIKAFSRTSKDLVIGHTYIGTMQVIEGKNGYLKVYELFDSSDNQIRKKLDITVLSSRMFFLVSALPYVLILFVTVVFYRLEKRIKQNKEQSI